MVDKEFQLPQCPRCGATVVKIEGKDYYGCPNWKRPGSDPPGCEGTIWWLPGPSRYPEVWFSHKVASKSNPGHFHIVRVYESGDMDCPCFAGRTDKFCRHMKGTIEDMVNVMKRIRDKYIKPTT